MTLLTRTVAALRWRQVHWDEVNTALGACPVEVSLAWFDEGGELPEDVAERVESVVQVRD